MVTEAKRKSSEVEHVWHVSAAVKRPPRSRGGNEDYLLFYQNDRAVCKQQICFLQFWRVGNAVCEQVCCMASAWSLLLSW